MTCDMEIKTLLLDTADVAHALNINRATVRRYLWESSAPGRRYSNNPFPKPDGSVGGSLYWLEDRLPEILNWGARRKGQGSRING